MQATEPDGVAMEMPKWKCHKVVHALKIVQVDNSNPQPDEVLLFFEPPYQPRKMPSHWIGKHQPKNGGYFVVYDDGYESFSPRDAFESGYTRL